MRFILVVIFIGLFLPVHVFSQIKNIPLEEKLDSEMAIETSIAINPRNPLNIVAAASPDRLYLTMDGGKTWQNKKMTSSFGVYGHPVVIADSKGTMYYFHLSDPTGEGYKSPKSLEVIVCQVSYDGGNSWDGGSPVGYNPPSDQHEFWASLDSKGNIFLAWTQFDKFLSEDSVCKSRIMLSSSGTGKKWTKPVEISQLSGKCLDNNETAAGSCPAVSDDKKVYITWSNAGNLYLDRSFDGGGMWLSNDILVSKQSGGRSLTIPGHGKCNGMPTLIVDRSKTERKGLLYMVWADQRNGEDDTDIWFLRSNNYGDYWTTPLRIGSMEKDKHQYLPTMAIDNTTGMLYVLYYDRSSYGDHQTDVYLAYSSDSGSTFKTMKISESPFVPEESLAFASYTHLSAHKGIVTPVWTRTDNGKTSILTAVIRQEQLPK